MSISSLTRFPNGVCFGAGLLSFESILYWIWPYGANPASLKTTQCCWLRTIFHLLNCAARACVVCLLFPCDTHAWCHHGDSAERVRCLVESQGICSCQIAAPGSLEILPSGRWFFACRQVTFTFHTLWFCCHDNPGKINGVSLCVSLD